MTRHSLEQSIPKLYIGVRFATGSGFLHLNPLIAHGSCICKTAAIEKQHNARNTDAQKSGG